MSSDAIELTKKRLESLARGQSHSSKWGVTVSKCGGGRSRDFARIGVRSGSRNNGIDAILKQEFNGGPVTVRVQRQGETLLDAAQKLSRASAGKGAKVMFVVALARGGCFEFADELPSGVVPINAPVGIREHMDRITREHL